MKRGTLYDDLVTMNIKVERKQREFMQKLAREKKRSISSIIREQINQLRKEK